MNSILRIAAWEKLPIEAILNLCSSNRELSQICANPTTWNILLKRDYNIDYRGNNPVAEYTRNVIRDIVSLLYQLNQDLPVAVEFLGYSNTNSYSMVHGNKIGSKTASVLKSLTLFSLVDYRQNVENKILAIENRAKQQQEEKRRQEAEIKRRAEDEQYFQQHGMFGLLE